MPYITQGARDCRANEQALDLNKVATTAELALRDRDPGALNYLLSRIAGAYVFERQRQTEQLEGIVESGGSPESVERALNLERTTRPPGYAQRAEVLGTLESFLHEFKRRVLDPHERQAQGRNGDVHEYEALQPPLEVNM